MGSAPETLFERVWKNHLVVPEGDAPAVLYIDLHLVHEVTSPQAFEGLRRRGLRVRRPDRTVATMDHSTPTTPRSLGILDPQAAAQLAQQLNQLNVERRQVETQMKQDALTALAQFKLDATEPPAALILFEPHWHQGVIGIVAGRLKEQFHFLKG